MSFRRIAGTIALFAMMLSLGEGLLAGVCATRAADAADFHATHGVAAPHTAAAPHAAGAFHGAGASDAAGTAPHDGDADDSAADCPMSGAAPAGCSAFAVALVAPARAPVAASTYAPVNLPAERMPASPAGIPLFHPPRA